MLVIFFTKSLNKNKRTIVVLYRSPETPLPIIWAWRPSSISNHNLFSSILYNYHINANYEISLYVGYVVS